MTGKKRAVVAGTSFMAPHAARRLAAQVETA